MVHTRAHVHTNTHTHTHTGSDPGLLYNFLTLNQQMVHSFGGQLSLPLWTVWFHSPLFPALLASQKRWFPDSLLPLASPQGCSVVGAGRRLSGLRGATPGLQIIPLHSSRQDRSHHLPSQFVVTQSGLEKRRGQRSSTRLHAPEKEASVQLEKSP